LANKNIPASLASLNKQQKAAVTAEDKRVLVIAGAISGKTQSLLQKILYLINEKGAKPSEILAITFTKNAANEMIDRLILSVDFDGEYKDILPVKRSLKVQKIPIDAIKYTIPTGYEISRYEHSMVFVTIS